MLVEGIMDAEVSAKIGTQYDAVSDERDRAKLFPMLPLPTTREAPCVLMASTSADEIGETPLVEDLVPMFSHRLRKRAARSATRLGLRLRQARCS